MSRENIEVMRAAMEAFNRRDSAGFGALLARDAEIVPVRTAVEGTVYRGPDAADQYCAAVDETWKTLTWEVEGIRTGDGWVLALGRIHGCGRGSGVTLDVSGAWLAHFDDGRVTRFQTFPKRADALQAVGLQE